MLLSGLILLIAVPGCDSDNFRYQFTQQEYTAAVGEPLQLHVNRIKKATDANPQDTASDFTDKATDWSVDPKEGATISKGGLFTANRPGAYTIIAYYPNGMFAETVVTVTGSAAAPAVTSSQQDGSRHYTAKLPGTPCVSSSPDRNRSTEEADLVFTVSGEDVSVEVTSSSGTRTYKGKINPGDGKFSITSDTPRSSLQVVGMFTDTSVTGVWTTTYNDGDQCIITFKGTRA